MTEAAIRISSHLPENTPNFPLDINRKLQYSYHILQ